MYAYTLKEPNEEDAMPEVPKSMVIQGLLWDKIYNNTLLT